MASLRFILVCIAVLSIVAAQCPGTLTICGQLQARNACFNNNSFQCNSCRNQFPSCFRAVLLRTQPVFSNGNRRLFNTGCPNCGNNVRFFNPFNNFNNFNSNQRRVFHVVG